MKKIPTNKDEREAEVIKVITRLSGHNAADIRRETSFRDDLGLDSLALYELVVDMEEAFGLQISDEELDRFFTLGDVLAYLDRRF